MSRCCSASTLGAISAPTASRHKLEYLVGHCWRFDAVEQRPHVTAGDAVQPSAAPARQHMPVQQTLGLLQWTRAVTPLGVSLDELRGGSVDSIGALRPRLAAL